MLAKTPPSDSREGAVAVRGRLDACDLSAAAANEVERAKSRNWKISHFGVPLRFLWLREAFRDLSRPVRVPRSVHSCIPCFPRPAQRWLRKPNCEMEGSESRTAASAEAGTSGAGASPAASTGADGKPTVVIVR